MKCQIIKLILPLQRFNPFLCRSIPEMFGGVRQELLAIYLCNTHQYYNINIMDVDTDENVHGSTLGHE